MKKILILSLLIFFNLSAFSQTNLEKYNLEKKDASAPFFLNTFLGFGIGSFVQGDYVGGSVALSLDLVGWSMLGYGASVLWVSIPFAALVPSGGSIMSVPGMKLGVSLTLVGVSILLISRITQMIIPWSYAENFNKKLSKELKLAFGDFEPIFNINFNDETKIGFNLALSKVF